MVPYILLPRLGYLKDYDEDKLYCGKVPNRVEKSININYKIISLNNTF